MTYQEAVKAMNTGKTVARKVWGKCYLVKIQGEIIVMIDGRKVIYDGLSHDLSASDWYVIC
jgi:hypothetical protein